MKTVVNKSRAPIRVPLPRGKSLFLGVGKEGQIRNEASEHPPIQKLVEAGTIAIFDGGTRPSDTAASAASPHQSTHAQKSTSRQGSGDR